MICLAAGGGTILSFSPAKAREAGWNVNQDGRVRTAWDYLGYKDISLETLSKVWPELSDIDPAIAAQLEIEALYSGYIERQAGDVEALRVALLKLLNDPSAVKQMGRRGRKAVLQKYSRKVQATTMLASLERVEQRFILSQSNVPQKGKK